jgi:hypothetical protein
VAGASGKGDPAGRGGALPQHPMVGRRRPDPAAPAQRVTVLVGLPGDSDRPDHQRLYLTTALDYYAEFLVADIVHSEEVPADKSPFSGVEATKVEVSRDATISYTWSSTPHPVDQFDLDVRLGQARSLMAAQIPQTRFCLTPLCGTVVVGTAFCQSDLCATDDTCLPNNCQTLPTDIDCQTQDGPTCNNTCADTCGTCNQTQCLPTCDITCANTCQPWYTAQTCTCGVRCVVWTNNPACQVATANAGCQVGTVRQ